MVLSRKTRYFLAAANHLHFSAAAEELHISQPALSRGIQQLEKRLGMLLFERTAKGVNLTPYGELLARRIRLMTLDAEHTLAELEAIKEGTSGRLHIGAVPVWLRVFLPDILRSLQRQYPNLQIDVLAGIIDTLLPALMNGKIDVICGDLDFPGHPGVETLHLTDITFVVVANKDHPLALKDSVTARDLAQYPWMTMQGHYSMRTRIGAFFAAQNIEPPRAQMVVSPGASTLDFLATGHYVSILPKEMLPLAHIHNCVRLLTTTSFGGAPHGVVLRRRQSPEASVSAFVSLLKDRFRSEKPTLSSRPMQSFPVNPTP